MVGSYGKGMGIGTYVHTGNESDLTCTDFLEYFGDDPKTRIILMYIEGLRDGRRFLEAAAEATQKKPVIAFKAGHSEAGKRATSSHTGAMAGSDQVYSAAFKQTGVIRSPSMELMVTLGHAFLELPPLKSNRIGIITFPGGWGAIVADALIRRGLKVPEFSSELKQALSDLGVPYWASLKNPIDIGAAGGRAAYKDLLGRVSEMVLASDEIDGLVVYGLGSTSISMKNHVGDTPVELEEGEHFERLYDLSEQYRKPVLSCTFLPREVSQAVEMLVGKNKRVYHNVEEIGIILASLYQHYSRSGP